MEECWSQDPSCRPTIQTVNQSLQVTRLLQPRPTASPKFATSTSSMFSPAKSNSPSLNSVPSTSSIMSPVNSNSRGRNVPPSPLPLPVASTSTSQMISPPNSLRSGPVPNSPSHGAVLNPISATPKLDQQISPQGS